MKPDRAWVRLSSGRRLNLIAPQPTDWTDLDLAVGLSRTPVISAGGTAAVRTAISTARDSRTFSRQNTRH